MSGDVVLERLGWSQSNYERQLDALGRAVPGLDYAVFDFDNTCILNDIGDACYDQMVKELAFNFDHDDFWGLLDPEDAPDELRERVSKAKALAPSARAGHRDYLDYLGHMGRLSRDHDARHGHTHAYAWVVRLMVGMSEEEILGIAQRAYTQHLSSELTSDTLRDPRDMSAWQMPRGVRICQEIRTLMAAMRARGVQVWIVSASAQHWVIPMARCFGVEPQHVVGNLLEPDEHGLMSDRLVMPATYRAGKLVRALERMKTDRLPWMAYGDAMTDFEMLTQAQGLAMVMDRGQQELHQHALDRGWGIQPRASLSFVQDDRGE